MNKEEFLKAIMELSKVETINPISTINSINVDDLMSAIDRLNKVPTYDELLKENKKQKEVIDRIINETKETRNILNNNRDDNILSKSCLLSYLEIVEDLLKEVSE